MRHSAVNALNILRKKPEYLAALLAAAIPCFACQGCPLAPVCPARATVFLAIYTAFASLTERIRSLRMTRRAAAILVVLAVAAAAGTAALSMPGADRLSVAPTSVTVQPGQRFKVTATVVFAHRQPCPHPDWKITYKASPAIKVVSETRAAVDPTGRKAVKEFTVEASGNGTLTVIFVYGTGCPFGSEERATVKITVVSQAQSGGSEQPQQQPEQPQGGVQPAARPSPLELIYEYRALILYALLALAVIAVLTGRRRGNPGKPSYRRARLFVGSMSVLLLLLVPFALTGTVCPCMIGSLQYAALLASGSAGGPLPQLLLDPYFAVFAVAVVSSLIIPRLWCGWICPIGFVQDALAVRAKASPPKRLHEALSKVKYAVLVLVVAATVASGTQWFCSNACFITAFTVTIYQLRLSSAVLFAVALALITLSAAVPRFFCRYLCPMGALLEILSRLRLRVASFRRTERCRSCRVCVAMAECPMGAGEVGGPGCISCGKCAEKCPFAGISLR